MRAGGYHHAPSVNGCGPCGHHRQGPTTPLTTLASVGGRTVGRKPAKCQALWAACGRAHGRRPTREARQPNAAQASTKAGVTQARQPMAPCWCFRVLCFCCARAGLCCIVLMLLWCDSGIMLVTRVSFVTCSFSRSAPHVVFCTALLCSALRCTALHYVALHCSRV